MAGLQEAIRAGTIIYTQSSGMSIDPADWWNMANSSRDAESLRCMICKAGVADASGLIGKKVFCAGSTGLGAFGATIKRVDLGMNYIEVMWDSAGGLTWKTAKLCWIQ